MSQPPVTNFVDSSATRITRRATPPCSMICPAKMKKGTARRMKTSEPVKSRCVINPSGISGMITIAIPQMTVRA